MATFKEQHVLTCDFLTCSDECAYEQEHARSGTGLSFTVDFDLITFSDDLSGRAIHKTRLGVRQTTDDLSAHLLSD